MCLPNGERPPPNETCYTVGYGAVTSFLFTMSKAIMLDWKDINSNLSDYFSKYFQPMTRSGQGKGDSGAPVLCQVWKSTFFLNDTLFRVDWSSRFEKSHDKILGHRLVKNNWQFINLQNFTENLIIIIYEKYLLELLFLFVVCRRISCIWERRFLV